METTTKQINLMGILIEGDEQVLLSLVTSIALQGRLDDTVDRSILKILHCWRAAARSIYKELTNNRQNIKITNRFLDAAKILQDAIHAATSSLSEGDTQIANLLTSEMIEREQQIRESDREVAQVRQEKGLPSHELSYPRK